MTKNERAEYMRVYTQAHPDYRKKCSANQIAKRKALRSEVLAAFGNKCSKCGFADARALQIDHINGDGYKEPRGYTYIRLRNILNDPNRDERYQLLCANCNWIKREEKREYRFIYDHNIN